MSLTDLLYGRKTTSPYRQKQDALYESTYGSQLPGARSDLNHSLDRERGYEDDYDDALTDQIDYLRRDPYSQGRTSILRSQQERGQADALAGAKARLSTSLSRRGITGPAALAAKAGLDRNYLVQRAGADNAFLAQQMSDEQRRRQMVLALITGELRRRSGQVATDMSRVNSYAAPLSAYYSNAAARDEAEAARRHQGLIGAVGQLAGAAGAFYGGGGFQPRVSTSITPDYVPDMARVARDSGLAYDEDIAYEKPSKARRSGVLGLLRGVRL